MPALVQHFLGKAHAEGLPLKTLSHRGDGAAQGAHLAGQCARAREPRPPPRRALCRGRDRRGGDRRSSSSQARPATRRRATGRPATTGLASAVERHLDRYFRAHDGGLPAPGVLRPAAARDRAAADCPRPAGDPGQPAEGGRRAGPQPQHAAQEDPRAGHPGDAQRHDRGHSRATIGTAPLEVAVLLERSSRAGPRALGAVSAGFDIERRARARPVAISAVVSGMATYAVISGAPPLGPDVRTVLVLLNLDLVLLLLLGFIIARRLVELCARAAPGLGRLAPASQLVALFGGLSVTPAVLVALFSVVLPEHRPRGLVQRADPERARRTRSAVARPISSRARENIRADALAMAADLNREGAMLRSTKRAAAPAWSRRRRRSAR